MTVAEFLGWPIGKIVDWAIYLWSPARLAEDCLVESTNKGISGVVSKFWLFPISLSIALDLVLVFSAFGFDLETQAPAFLLYLVYTSLKWFIGAVAINLLLKLFRQTEPVPEICTGR